MLVGTQIDLKVDQEIKDKLAKSKQKIITPEQGEKLAKDLKAVKYVECSALTQVFFFKSIYFIQNKQNCMKNVLLNCRRV